MPAPPSQASHRWNLSALLLTAGLIFAGITGSADGTGNHPQNQKGLSMPASRNASLKAATAVSYLAFGAKGDGVTDDCRAIAAAHDYANQHGLPVQADSGKTFYIGGNGPSIIIKTDTDFGSARFLIDDRAVQNRSANVFQVESQLQPFQPEGISSLHRNQSELGITLPCDCLITVNNANIKRYIRFGLNQNTGSAQTDIFLADRQGRIDPETPIVWDFPEITSITALPLDSTTLTLRGGHFTTIANAEESKYNYYARGIAICRSKVLVENLRHEVSGEGEHGAPYSGFLYLNRCAEVVIRDTVLTGRRTYWTTGAIGKPVNMGSYDISAKQAVKVSLLNCSQTNDINDRQYWGIFASNFCKKLVFDGCTLSRFDAHQGVANASIRNSTLGYMGINAIGCGTLTVENSTIHASRLINLRADYGSTWQGEFIIRNCVFAPPEWVRHCATLIGGSYSGQHDFGYPCSMPARITIDGLQIRDGDAPDNYAGPAIFADFNPEHRSAEYKEKYPLAITREVGLRNIRCDSGKPLRLSDNLYMFREVKVIPPLAGQQ
ncbi:MAG: hypothetical protein GX902_04990 [Lentisphaerae bacterium]|nr:hypothetical protein [Lentisphaerota bacterium]